MSHHDMPALIAALSPPVRRFVALGGAVLLIALVVGWVVQPALRWSAAKIEAWADARFVLARAQSAARAVQDVAPTVVDQEEAELRRLLLPGETEAEAAAALQSLVSQMLSGQGLVVEGIKAEPTQDRAGLRGLHLGWRGNGDEPAVMQALVRLEQARPLVRLDRLVVGVVSVAGTESRVSLELRVVAFWAPPLYAEAARAQPGAAADSKNRPQGGPGQTLR
ncbi:MAG: type II secretion system protein GspM [bacterium]